MSYLINEGYKRRLVELINEVDCEQLGRVAHKIAGCDHLFIIGNGGSLCNAHHAAEDLLKCAGIRACVPADLSLLTASANDNGYENSFLTALYVHACKDDMLLAISGSGNSRNIVGAAQWFPGYSVGLAGFSGGRLKKYVDEIIIVHDPNMRLIEDVHCAILHMLVNAVCQIRGRK